jgi:hydrogenase maturation protease
VRTRKADKILVLAYGNPARRDDGLGPELARAVEAMGIEGVTVDIDYQLQLETAVDVAEHEVVIFADASVSGEEPFRFEPLAPKAELSFSSHSVSPAALLALARDLFGSDTLGFVLGIRGHEFEGFGEGLGEAATRNLDAAVRFIEPVLREAVFPTAAG